MKALTYSLLRWKRFLAMGGTSLLSSSVAKSSENVWTLVGDCEGVGCEEGMGRRNTTSHLKTELG